MEILGFHIPVWVFFFLGVLVGLSVFLFWYYFVRVSSRVPPFAALPESRFLELDGVQVHYVQTGGGPSVVLFHGIGASVFIWRYLIPLLAKNFTVTALDLPGFGRSDEVANYGLDAQTERIEKILSLLGIDQALLVGSSMGGAIALWLGKLHPDRFPKIVALNPAADSSLVPLPVFRLQPFSPLFKWYVNRWTIRAILSQIVTRGELIGRDVVHAYLEPYRKRGGAIRAVVAATALLGDHRLPQDLCSMQNEVLLIWGERDRLVWRKSILRLKECLQNSQLLVHPEAGHHIMEDEPEWVNEKILEFQGAKA